MLYTLQNELVQLQVNDRGAELWSLVHKPSGMEHLWQGDPVFWARRAPLLFPICGRLSDARAPLPGASGRMRQHGFARDCLPELVEETRNSLLFRLAQSEETLAVYPHSFRLEIRFVLEGARLRQECTVRNPGGAPLPFSIGFHAGLRCPFDEAHTAADYRVVFDSEARAERALTDTNALLTGEREAFPVSPEGVCAADARFSDTVLLRDSGLRFAGLRESDSGREMRVSFENLPHLAMWRAGREAPFLCIEPWNGLPDPVDATGALESKPGICVLAPGEIFRCAQVLEILGER